MIPSASRFVVYLRVSTDKQGKSGLGLDAQRAAVAGYITSQAGASMVAEFQEVESGKLNDRPQLAAALAACRAHRATLLIAKLDRLACNVRFLLSIVEGTGEGRVVFCDLPTVPAGPVGKFIITQMAAVAELEAGLISQRTKAALAQAKVHGVKLGNPMLRAGTPDMAPQGSRRPICPITPARGRCHAANSSGAKGRRRHPASRRRRHDRPWHPNAWPSRRLARRHCTARPGLLRHRLAGA